MIFEFDGTLVAAGAGDGDGDGQLMSCLLHNTWQTGEDLYSPPRPSSLAILWSHPAILLLWIQQQIESNSVYLTDDTRFYNYVQPIKK